MIDGSPTTIKIQIFALLFEIIALVEKDEFLGLSKFVLIYEFD